MSILMGVVKGEDCPCCGNRWTPIDEYWNLDVFSTLEKALEDSVSGWLLCRNGSVVIVGEGKDDIAFKTRDEVKKYLKELSKPLDT